MSTFIERVHEAHVRLGIKSGNCSLCRDERPEWVKRAREHRLPLRIEWMGRAA